jgi:hypothetical protein
VDVVEAEARGAQESSDDNVALRDVHPKYRANRERAGDQRDDAGAEGKRPARLLLLHLRILRQEVDARREPGEHAEREQRHEPAVEVVEPDGLPGVDAPVAAGQRGASRATDKGADERQEDERRDVEVTQHVRP